MAHLSKSLMGLLGIVIIATSMVTFVLARDSEIERAARAAEIQSQTASAAAVDAAKLGDLIATNNLTQAVEQAAFMARVFATQIWYVGQVLFLVMLGLVLVGGAGLFLLREAMTIRPSASGQMPLVHLKGAGWQTLVDTNRMPGPIAILRTPTIIDYLIWAYRTMRGQEPQPLVPIVETPIAVSETATLAIAQQAAMVAIAAGATRHEHALAAGKTLDSVFGAAAAHSLNVQPVAQTERLLDRPQIEEIKSAHVERLLASMR